MAGCKSGGLPVRVQSDDAEPMGDWAASTRLVTPSLLKILDT